MKEFINNKYNESIVFKFSDILINENNMLLSDIAWGIFWFNITESNNITFVNFDKIVDVKKMELYKTNNYRSKKQTLIIWLETQNDKLQSIQEYDIASKNYIITLLKETQLGLFTAKTETLAGDYIYLAQDNLIKLYRPNIPLETESFELNDLYFDSIKLIKSFDSNKSLPSFIIVQSESILIYNMEMSFMVICKNLENIDEDYSINYEFKTLSCEENMTYYENDNFYYCVFPVKDNIELPYYDNIKEIGLIIGLTIGLVFILIILVFVCLSFKRLRNKYQILAQKEKKNPK